MPTDPSIILQGQQPQIDFANIYATAMQLRSMKQQNDTQNALRAILAQPDSVDQTSGSVTPNALAKIARIDPKTAADLAAKSSEVAERKAQIAHTTSETAAAQQKQDTEFLSGAVGEYDASLATGGTAPDIAASNLKQAIRDHIQAQPYSQDQKDAAWAKFASMSPAQIRAASLDSQQRFEMQKQTAAEQSERTPATMGGKPVLVDKAGAVYDPNTGAKIPVTAPVEREATVLDPTRAALTQEAKWTVVTDPKTQTQYRYNPETGESTTLDGKEPYVPQGQEKLTPGQTGASLDASGIEYAAERYRDTGIMPALGMGAAAAKMREQIIEKAAQLSGGGTAGADSDVATAAATRADTSSLTNITRIADSAAAYEDTAKKNFDLALSLAPKGIPTDMGPFFNSWIQKGETALGDPNVPPYVAALLTGANEYAKVMSGSTGSQGSTVDSRREAAELFSRAYTPQQITNVIGIAERDMENKKASYTAKVEGIRHRISGEGTVPAGAPPPKFTAPTIGSVAADAKGHKIRLTKDGWVDAETGKPVS